MINLHYKCLLGTIIYNFNKFLVAILIPNCTAKPLAPKFVLYMVSSGYSPGCGKSFKCHKAGLDYTAMCSTCLRFNCYNSCLSDGNGCDE